MNLYKELRDKQQAESNAFPMKFAFSDKQFDEGMAELGLTKNDTDKVIGIPCGGFIRKTDLSQFKAMFKKHDEEMADAIKKDKTGNGFIYDMFNYELGNHEYCITYDATESLMALGLTWDDVNKDERMVKALNKAMEHQREWYAMNG